MKKHAVNAPKKSVAQSIPSNTNSSDKLIVENQINTPKVSVIIPVYNVEPYLRKCIDSVINQTLREIEIICIDDGSPDNCGKILDDYASKDKRIKVIHKQNEGLAFARNTGLEHATGEYIGFIDSDDWIDENFYECLYRTAKLSGSDIVKGNICIVYKNGKSSTDIRNSEIRKVLKDKKALSVKFCYEFWTAIYNRRLIEDNRIRFSKTTFGEDIDFLCAVTCKTEKYDQRDDVYYYYRQNDLSIS